MWRDGCLYIIPKFKQSQYGGVALIFYVNVGGVAAVLSQETWKDSVVTCGFCNPFRYGLFEK